MPSQDTERRRAVRARMDRIQDVLSDALVERMTDDRARGWRNPYRTDDAQALRVRSGPGTRPNIWRPAFVRDVEKIIHTPAYNRYAGKDAGLQLPQQRRPVAPRPARAARGAHRAATSGTPSASTPTSSRPSASATTSATHPSAMRGSAVSTRCSTSARDAGSFTTCIPCACSTCSTVGTSPCRCSTGRSPTTASTSSRCSSFPAYPGFEAFDDVVERCYTQGGLAIGHLRPMTLEGCVVRISDIIAYVGRDRQDAIEAGLLGEDAFEDGLGGAYNSWILSHAAADIIEHSLRFGPYRHERGPLFGDSARQGGELRQDLPLERYRGRARRGARARPSAWCTAAASTTSPAAMSRATSSVIISRGSSGRSRTTGAATRGMRIPSRPWSITSRA